MNYYSVFKNILKDINILKPQIISKNITEIDYKSLKEKGIKYLIFDKDNTLTLTYQSNFHSPQIQ
jgi:predicted HAD superfamily phosphohydrolase YqeG